MLCSVINVVPVGGRGYFGVRGARGRGRMGLMGMRQLILSMGLVWVKFACSHKGLLPQVRGSFILITTRVLNAVIYAVKMLVLLIYFLLAGYI
jgi:hypothetical protein